MSAHGFTLGFSKDDSRCTVVDDETKRVLLVVSVRGPVDDVRRDKIAHLVGDVIAECLNGIVYLAKFDETEVPS